VIPEDHDEAVGESTLGCFATYDQGGRRQLVVTPPVAGEVPTPVASGCGFGSTSTRVRTAGRHQPRAEVLNGTRTFAAAEAIS
jgi:hypothetical protein